MLWATDGLQQFTIFSWFVLRACVALAQSTGEPVSHSLSLEVPLFPEHTQNGSDQGQSTLPASEQQGLWMACSVLGLGWDPFHLLCPHHESQSSV